MKRSYENDNIPRTMMENEILGHLNVSSNTFRKMWKNGHFPKPLPTGGAANRWSRTIVNDWFDGANTHDATKH